MLNKIVQNPGKMYLLIKIFAFSLPMLLFAGSHVLDLSGNNSDDPYFNACHNCIGGIVMVAPDEGWIPTGVNQIVHYYQGALVLVPLPLDSDGSITSLSMTSANNGWALASEGNTSTSQSKSYSVFLHYQNGQWRNTHLIAPDMMFDITMVTSDDGWAVGDNGRIMHFDGQQWSTYVVSGSGHIETIRMLSVDEGWAVGNNSLILHYLHGQWHTEVSPIENEVFSSIAVHSSDDVWFGTYDSSALLHYDGHSWQTVVIPSPLHYPNGYAQINLINSDWAIGYVIVHGPNAYQNRLRGETLLHYQGGQWVPSSLFQPNIYPEQFIAPDEAWGSGTVHRYGAEQGIIAHYYAGTWHTMLVPRLPEPLWIFLLRIGAGIVVLGGFFLQISFIIKSFIPNIRKQLRAVWLVRIGMLAGMTALGGYGAIVLEPLLFPFYNEDFRHNAQAVGIVGICAAIICMFASLFVKRTPKSDQGQRI